MACKAQWLFMVSAALRVQAFGRPGLSHTAVRGLAAWTIQKRTTVIRAPHPRPKTKARWGVKDHPMKMEILKKKPEDYPLEFRDGRHYVLDVSRKEAKLYRTEFKGSKPEVLKAMDLWEQGTGDMSDEDRSPVTDSKNPRKSITESGVRHYVRHLERLMEGADTVLLLGHGHGKGNLAEEIVKDIQKHRPHLQQKILGPLRIDDTHMSSNQLLALAREVMSGHKDERKPLTPPPGAPVDFPAH